MPRSRKKEKVLVLVLWNLVVWTAAAHLSGELPPRSPRLPPPTSKLRSTKAGR